MHYTTIEQAKKLLEMGINPETCDMSYRYDHNEHAPKETPEVLVTPLWDDDYCKDVPCWSTDALWALLPKTLYEVHGHTHSYSPQPKVDADGTWWVEYIEDAWHVQTLECEYGATLLVAVYKMLLTLHVKNYPTTELEAVERSIKDKED